MSESNYTDRKMRLMRLMRQRDAALTRAEKAEADNEEPQKLETDFSVIDLPDNDMAKEFKRAMENRQYGRPALTDAWAWFEVGWTRARRRAEECALCGKPGCNLGCG